MWSYVATKTPLVLLSVLISALTCRDVHAEYLAYVGDGRFLYQLDVVQDVWLERSNANYNNLDSLIVGEHLGFPLKRSLLQFEDLPADSGCDEVVRAHMYLYFYSAHKPSFYTDDQVPYARHLVDVHPVLKPWDEAQATTTKRLDDEYWEEEYLALDGIDAAEQKVGRVAMNPGQPKDAFVELKVTRAVKQWASGELENNGVLIKVRREDNTGKDLRFYSNHYSDSSKHAKIIVLCKEAS